MKYIYLLIGILMIGTVAAYTSPDSDDIDLELDAGTYYAAPSSDSIDLVLDLEAPTDSCTYDVGDWEVNCADYCNITSDVEAGGNHIILNGAGVFTIAANITADSISVVPTCRIIKLPNDGNVLAIAGG